MDVRGIATPLCGFAISNDNIFVKRKNVKGCAKKKVDGRPAAGDPGVAKGGDMPFTGIGGALVGNLTTLLRQRIFRGENALRNGIIHRNA